MADEKISNLVELLKANVGDTDLLPIVNAGQTKKIQFGTIKSIIGDAIDAAIVAFRETFGVLAMVASGSILNSITAVYSKVKIVDSVDLNKINGHITHSFVDDNCTIDTNGVYSFSVFGSFTAPVNEAVTFAWHVNGGLVSTPAEFLGNGSKPVAITGNMLLDLVAGDVVDIRAKGDSNIDITIISAQYIVEKTHHL